MKTMMTDAYGENESVAEEHEDTAGTRLGIAVGAIVIVGLVFLCFQFALRSTGSGGSGASRNRMSSAPDARRDPGSPGGVLSAAPASAPSPAAPRPLALPRPAAPAPPVTPPRPVTAGVAVFGSPEEQAAVQALLKEVRAAYESALSLGGGSSAAPDAAAQARPRLALPLERSAAPASTSQPYEAGGGEEIGEVPSADAVRNGEAPLEVPPVPGGASSLPAAPLAVDPETLRTEADALEVVVTLNTHPALYPETLRDEVRVLNYELRTSLSTLNLAASAAPEQAGAFQSAAAAHLARAGALLSRLEGVARTGVLPPSPGR